MQKIVKKLGAFRDAAMDHLEFRWPLYAVGLILAVAAIFGVVGQYAAAAFVVAMATLVVRLLVMLDREMGRAGNLVRDNKRLEADLSSAGRIRAELATVEARAAYYLKSLDEYRTQRDELRQELAKDERRVNTYDEMCQHLSRQLLHTAARLCTDGDKEGEIYKIRDHAVLEVLTHLGERIAFDRQYYPNSWPTAPNTDSKLAWSVRQALENVVGRATLRAMLIDLVEHRNDLYVGIIDRMPPDVAQCLMRMTVAQSPPSSAPATAP